MEATGPAVGPGSYADCRHSLATVGLLIDVQDVHNGAAKGIRPVVLFTSAIHHPADLEPPQGHIRKTIWVGAAPARLEQGEVLSIKHNGWVPRDFWLEEWEKQAIIAFNLKNPLEGPPRRNAHPVKR